MRDLVGIETGTYHRENVRPTRCRSKPHSRFKKRIQFDPVSFSFAIDAFFISHFPFVSRHTLSIWRLEGRSFYAWSQTKTRISTARTRSLRSLPMIAMTRLACRKDNHFEFEDNDADKGHKEDTLRIWPSVEQSGHGSGGDDIVNLFEVLQRGKSLHEGVAFASPRVRKSRTQACRGHADKQNV